MASSDYLLVRASQEEPYLPVLLGVQYVGVSFSEYSERSRPYLLFLWWQQQSRLGGRKQHGHEGAVDVPVGAGAYDAPGQLRDGRSMQDGSVPMPRCAHG